MHTSDLLSRNSMLKLNGSINPLMPKAVKSSLTKLMKSYSLEVRKDNISRENVNQDIANNSLSIFLLNHGQFHGYFQKYHNTRRQLLKEILSINGLSIY